MNHDAHVRDYRSRTRAIQLLEDEPVLISMARVQYVEREERRAALERELAGEDARACIERVRRRMTHGDKVWIPPMHGAAEAYRAWRRRNRYRLRRVTQLQPSQRKEA